MLTIVQETTFRQSYKSWSRKANKSIVEKLDQIILELADHQITTQYHNHPLTGSSLRGVYELHVDGDVLLIYRYKNHGTELEILNLIDLTDHKTLKNPKYQKMIKKRYNSSYEVNNMNKEQLNEAPTQFTIPRDLLNDPDSLDVGEIAKKADADAKEKAKKADLEAKGKEIVDKFKADERYNSPDAYDVLEAIFENSVPAQGKADTEGGEIARAMMRLNYRNYNDGDVFFSGYGLETCAPSAAFLMDADEGIASTIYDIMDAAGEYDYDIESDYAIDLRSLTEIVVDYLKNNPMLFGMENTKDSLDTDIRVIKDNMPTYDYEPDTSNENLDILLEKDILSHSDVYQAVDDIANSLCSSRYNIEEIYRNSYVITNIDAEDLGRLEEDFENEFNDWVQSEYDSAYEQGFLDDDEDDFDDEDEEDIDEELDEDFDPDYTDPELAEI